MQLFNSGGAVFGPGSEWLWAMTQVVVVVVTLFGIYRQLRAQAAGNAIARMTGLSSRWESRLLTLARLRSGLQLRYGESRPGLSAEMMRVLDFFVDLGNLREQGHITLDEIDNNWGFSIQLYAAILHPRIEEQRRIDGDPTLWSGLKELAADLHERRLKRGGSPLVTDDASTPGWLDEIIRRNTAGLELLRDAESDVIPRPPADSPVPETA